MEKQEDFEKQLILREFSPEKIKSYITRINTDERYASAKKRLELKPIFKLLIKRAINYQIFYGVDLQESIKLLEDAEKNYKIYVGIKLAPQFCNRCQEPFNQCVCSEIYGQN